MYKKRILSYFLFLVGFILILFGLNFNFTGFVVNVGYPPLLIKILPFVGLIFIFGGFIVLELQSQLYIKTAAKIYETLARKSSYGHQTTNQTDLEKLISRGNVSKKDVSQIVEKEGKLGRLNTQKGISINMNPNVLDSIISLYGENILPEVLDRIYDLKYKKVMEGERGRGKVA
jgi:hypothetical protein